MASADSKCQRRWNCCLRAAFGLHSSYWRGAGNLLGSFCPRTFRTCWRMSLSKLQERAGEEAHAALAPATTRPCSVPPPMTAAVEKVVFGDKRCQQTTLTRACDDHRRTN